MKKLFLIIIAAMTIFFGSSFKPNTTSQQTQSETPQQDQCYRVKVIFDIVYETRTARWGGTVVNSKTMATDQVYTTPQCASSESEARDKAVHECYEACNNEEGKYIKETRDGLYMFEVRRVKRTEITGSCGDC